MFQAALKDGYLRQIPEFLLTHDLYFGFIQHLFLSFLWASTAETASSCHTAFSAESGV